ncbi:hypothetical protein L7F22_015334 [Adiantum nelumboides]|nr:hypothetical protein [Adiantum nelumboides]
MAGPNHKINVLKHVLNTNNPHTWILDLGASLHVTPHRKWFTTYKETIGSVALGDSYARDIMGVTDIAMVMANGVCFVIHNVGHVPSLTRNLSLVGRLDDLGYKVTFFQQSWHIAKGNLMVAQGSKVGSLYHLYVSAKNNVLSVNELPTVALWHSRLGHMSKKRMETLSHLGYVPSLSFFEFPFYEHCQYGKQTCASHNGSFEKERKPLQLVHSDVCGPMPTRYLGGAS